MFNEIREQLKKQNFDLIDKVILLSLPTTAASVPVIVTTYSLYKQGISPFSENPTYGFCMGLALGGAYVLCGIGSAIASTICHKRHKNLEGKIQQQ